MIPFVLGVIIATILFPITIPLQYKFGQVTAHKNARLGGGAGGVNSLWMKIQPEEQKNNVPNQGGVVIWIGFVLGVLILRGFGLMNQWPEWSNILNIFTIILGLYGLVGFIDVLLTNLLKSNMTLREVQERFSVRLIRFVIAWIPAFIGIYLLQSLENPELNLFSIKNLVPIFLMSIFVHFAVYSAELTDGLDGLMIGIFIIIYSTLLFLLPSTIYTDLWIEVIMLILGLSIVDLWLNKKPAKFFNGGAGTMPLGVGAVVIALQTNLVVPYLIVSSITWVIMFSSMFQILSMKLFKKRIFKIAPLHHHFQAIGWSEKKIVYIFWAYTAIAGVIATLVS